MANKKSEFNLLNDKRILITGGLGFIGGQLIRQLLKKTNSLIFNIDNLNYSSNIEFINNFGNFQERYFLYKLNLKDMKLVSKAINDSKPDLIFHLAAETHVDRSLDNPSVFIESNIIGTFNLLQAALNYYDDLPKSKKDGFRFQHISTDEVFGSLDLSGKFDEQTRYDPRSPYSASKASSDHLVRAWYYSYKLPIIVTNCSNNYGPYQYPEKLIPISIFNALRGREISIYGNGNNIRDWIYIDDHIDALLKVASIGKTGRTYCIGGNSEMKNIDLINIICKELDKIIPINQPYSSFIKYVKDRPGHDFRYAMNSSLIKKELGWVSKIDINKGIKKTVQWYVDNLEWCENMLRSSGYDGERLGN